MTRNVYLGVVFLLFFCAGFALSATTSTEGPLYVADFMVAQETPYGGGSDGIQFFGLQRIDSKQVDQATLSIDASLELAGALRLASLKKQRVRITLQAVQARTLQELRR